MTLVSIFADAYDRTPHHVGINVIFDRIKNGKSKSKIDRLRTTEDEDQRKLIKNSLPGVTFCGTFSGREDKDIIKFSGLACLDFDKLIDSGKFKTELCKNKFIYSAWVSPSGNGVKALIKVANQKKYDQHYAAILKDFKCDQSCSNIARLCFESADPEIYINPDSEIYTKTLSFETQTQYTGNNENFKKLLKWLDKSGHAFASGERNAYIFRLASACCRFGIAQGEAEGLISLEFPSDKSFSQKEMFTCIRSAYKRNDSGTAEFTVNEKLIETQSRAEIDPSIFMQDVEPQDIIYLKDCDSEIDEFWENGWKEAETTYITQLNEIWKWKRGDLNVLSGYGNHGKSAWLYFMCLIKSIKEDRKWCIFSPETYPARNFYIDLIEVYIGADCAPGSLKRPSKEIFNTAKDFISKHFFYIYPQTAEPTPLYLKERFLEMILKEKVDGCIIDPFNQMETDMTIRDDKFLSVFLSDINRFIKTNNIYFFIINHPSKPQRAKDGSYSCPSVFDLANGAMWNNKADNILIYHRPNFEKDRMDPICEVWSKKIKRQKEVGIPGMINLYYDRETRRFKTGGGYDPIEDKIFEIKMKPNPNLGNGQDFKAPEEEYTVTVDGKTYPANPEIENPF